MNYGKILDWILRVIVALYFGYELYWTHNRPDLSTFFWGIWAISVPIILGLERKKWSEDGDY